MNAPRLDAPIVLAHGMLGLAQVIIHGLRLGDYFRDIPAWLRAAGNDVLVTEVPGVGAIARRAEILRDQIRAWTKEPVHLIGHSQGGLDARYLITHLGMANQVLSLSTIGTPHRGSPVADWGVAHAERTGLFALLRKSPVDEQAFLDLTTASAGAFNQTTPDVPGVWYGSVAGDAPRERTLALLRFCHDIVSAKEGPNDGLVSVASARWGQECAIWPADHTHQIGWFCEPPFDWSIAWAEMLAKLPCRRIEQMESINERT